MTTAEKLRAEGLTQGRIEGRAETVIKLMTVKFGPLPDTALASVRAATAEQLENWAIRILTADTLDEVLH